MTSHTHLSLPIALALIVAAANAADVPPTGLHNSDPVPLAINDAAHVAGSHRAAAAGRFGRYWLDRAVTYIDDELTDLGTLGGLDSTAHAINNAGQVVGAADVDDGITHAVLFANDKLIDLGALGGWSSTAVDINDVGHIVGYSAVSTSPTTYHITHAVLWQNGAATDLGTLGGPSSRAFAVNLTTQIVGAAENADTTMHAFLWQNDTMTDLGTLGGTTSCAYDINDHGQIVGWARTDDDRIHAVLWQDGQITDIDTFNSDRSIATAINNAGQIVGHVINIDGYDRAFRHNNGLLTELPPLPGGTWSQAHAINASGQVLGVSNDDADTVHVVLWTTGQPTRLFSPETIGELAAPASATCPIATVLIPLIALAFPHRRLSC